MRGSFDYDGLPRYIRAMEAWFHEQHLAAFYKRILPDGKWRLFFGILVFGDYADRFLDLTVPSLLAPGNIDCLFEPTIVVHTDHANLEKIDRGLEKLREFARVEIEVVPQAIIDMVPENSANKYWLLGTAHNLHMQQAKYRAHGYHMLMPDHVYSAGYFRNLQRLAESKPAIIQVGMSAILEDVYPILRRMNCVVEARKLNEIACDHLHTQIHPLMMNGRDDYPTSALMLFIGQNAVHITSPHLSIVYLSHDLLMRAPVRPVNTIDGQLPYFIPPDVEPYVPMPEDDMSYMEVSVREKAYYKPQGQTLAEFCVSYWVMAFCNRDYQRFSDLTTVLPFGDGYAPPFPAMSDEEIERKKRDVWRAVSESYEQVYSVLPEAMKVDPYERIKKAA